jgi:hypothetical protein
MALPVLDAEIVSIDYLPVPRAPAQLVPLNRPITRPPLTEPKRGLIRRAIDDPFWILITGAGSLALAVVGTVIYGIVQILLSVGVFLSTYGSTIGGGVILLILIVLLGSGGAACAGLHCAGCKR